MEWPRGRQAIGWATLFFAAGALFPVPWQLVLSIMLLSAFFFVWSFAPHQVRQTARRISPDWKLDEKLERLAEALEGPAPVPAEHVDEMLKLLDAGTEIMKREVHVPEFYEKWKRDLDAWVSATAAFLELHFGNADREMFMVLEPSPAGTMPGALDEQHSRDLRQLMNRLRRLRMITKRYGVR
jgi:hypothetical protein